MPENEDDIQEMTTRMDVPETTEDQLSVMDQIPGSSGKGAAQLVANYKSIVSARAIYYPVAYRFARELGRGRQGIVFAGLRQGARGCITRHAIKLFDPSIYPNAKKYWTDMGRIAAQTSKLQNIKSPNLVAPDIYEEYNGIGYVQMEAIDGVGLRYLLDGQHLDRVKRASTPQQWHEYTDVIFRPGSSGKTAIQPGIAIYIARRVLRALESLHDLNFVHSDVKPGNILVDSLGYVKLIDYGRAVTQNEAVTFLLGTPLFMAPEMHRRERATLQSDIYAVGLVLLEMLRGESLFKGKTPPENDLLTFKMKLSERLPEFLPEHVRQNATFVDVMRRFLTPDLSKRFSSAQEAESGKNGLIIVHKQLALMGKDTEYGRELENYLSKLVNPKTGLIETGEVSSFPGHNEETVADVGGAN